MLDDDARIRAAKPEEAELLLGLAWRSMACWGCPPELINEFCASLTQEFLENNLSYLIEDESGGEILGFYLLEQDVDGQWWMRRHWVVPGHIGTCAGQLLFLHACEIAETVGADKLNILSDPGSEAFYLRMGAERVGAESKRAGGLCHEMPVLEIKLV